MNEHPEPLEFEARNRRDAIYGRCTEGNWQACKDHWLSPENLRWLRERTMEAPKQEL